MPEFLLNIQKNIIVAGASDRPLALDVIWPADRRPKPVLLFAHGFKGFKDWGHWHLLFEAIAREGFVCVRFNFSHNGISPPHSTDMVDMVAFQQNTYSRELEDLDRVITWVTGADLIPKSEADLQKIGLIGHSRGGPIVLIQTAVDDRIKAVATWASVHGLDYYWKMKGPAFLDSWKRKGYDVVINGRTGQEMPVGYGLYEDFIQSGEKLDVQRVLERLHKPGLIIHGLADLAVPVDDAWQLKKWQPAFRLELIPGADHVFGGRHPYEKEDLPNASVLLKELTSGFFKECLG